MKKGSLFLVKKVSKGVAKNGVPYTRITCDTIPYIILYEQGTHDVDEGDTVRIIELLGGEVQNYPSGQNQFKQQTTFSVRFEVEEKDYKKKHSEEYQWDREEDYLWRI